MMNKLFLSLAVCLIQGTAAVHAQSYQTRQKERMEMAKLSRAELNAKAAKAARKEAKRLKKAGWEIAPGALPLDKQLDKSYTMQYDYDEGQMPRYIMGEAISLSGTYNSAKMQAMELAKQNLTEQIQTEMKALVENTVANEQLSADEAASITRSVMSSQSSITQTIGLVQPVVEIYRQKKNGNTEVMVRLAYRTDMGLQAAKKAVRDDLAQKGDKLHLRLDDLLK